MNFSKQSDAYAETALVVDIGGTHVRIGHTADNVVFDESLNFSAQDLRVPDAFQVLLQKINNYVASQELHPSAVVVGLPAALDAEHNFVMRCNNLPQLVGVALKSELQKALGYTVIVEHDIMLQTLGETYVGATQHAAAVLGVFLGTGVGAGLVVDGRPSKRASTGLELGHIPIRAEGKRCVCGNLDCLEAYASGHTLTALAAAYELPVETLFTSADPRLIQELERFVTDQARAVATAVTLLDPELVVLGGGIPRMESFPKKVFETTVRQHLLNPYPAETLKLSWATLGRQAPLYGALALLNSQ